VTVLALKVALAPLLVVAATLAGRRWGAAVAGIVTAVPVVAGPILAIITIEHGREFGADAARSALLGLVALAAFCVAFARAAGAGRSWPSTLALGWLAYFAVAAALSWVEAPPPVLGVVAALAAILVAAWLIGPAPRRVTPDRPPPAWDLPARAGLTAVLVLALTGAAGALGPAVSGVLTPFPVAMSVIAAFVLAQDGPDAVRSLMHGFVRALPGFAISFFAVAIVL
jgi:hypothetical protein